MYVFGGSLLSWLNYDYKGFGTQTFDVVIHPEKRSVSFVLPEGTPPPREPERMDSVDRKPMQRANSPTSAPGHQPPA